MIERSGAGGEPGQDPSVANGGLKVIAVDSVARALIK
jgi:hypothetical protein